MAMDTKSFRVLIRLSSWNSNNVNTNANEVSLFSSL